MPHVTKALVVDQPWIDLILSGAKTWEMRSTETRFRGWLGLIRKGSGAVVGIARLSGCGQALSQAEMIATVDRHHIPEPMIRSGQVANWTTPWHLAEAAPLSLPVAYRHPSGAVTWVNLDTDVTAEIAAVTGENALDVPMCEPMQPPTVRPDITPGDLVGEVVLTAGNLKNNHFYLRSFIHHLPDDLIGGRDAEQPVLAEVIAGGMAPICTDICARHLFFRDRAFTRAFFANTDAVPGDRVLVRQIAPYRFGLELKKA
ncbi:ASCH domain-containing protein [Cereibacter sp. SYSU M97828]|nr:ASCH domain-containing protein [Cereibacter flavus]